MLHTIIIGAGPAGLSAGYKLALGGAPVTVLEQDSEYVGGLARTLQYQGNRFDIGGHRFYSKSPEVVRFWEEMLGEELLKCSRCSRIFFDNTFLRYPLSLPDLFRNLGLGFGASCMFSYFFAKIFPQKDIRSFEDWIVAHFGRKLYLTFFKSYTEKVWGMKCNEISADWASQRIKGLSLSTVLKNLCSRTGGGRSGIKTLTNEFSYPRLGPGQLWERVRDGICENGGRVLLGHTVIEVHRNDAKFCGVKIKHEDGSTAMIEGDRLISTMPLAPLVQCLRPVVSESVCSAAAKLRYRDFLLVVLVLDVEQVFPDHWIYIHDPSVRVARIQNTKNWSSDLVPDKGKTVLLLEYFCFENDSFWNSSDQDLLGFAGKELEKLGLSRDAAIIDGTVSRVRNAYPVYDSGYAEAVRVVRTEVEQFDGSMQLIGRNGMHRYNNQDHAIMTGFLAARNILEGKSLHDPWKVNQEAEYLEEEQNGDLLFEDRLVPRVVAT